MSSRLMSLCAVALATMAIVSSCALIGDGWEEQRRQALERPRRALWNDDGCDIYYWPIDMPITVENARKLINWQAPQALAECKADTLIFNPLAAGFCNLITDTKCGDVITNAPAPETGKYAAAFPKLFEEGTDYLKLGEEFCRANGKEFFASMRMNDIHDAYWPDGKMSFLYPKFKAEHPEYLFGSLNSSLPHGVWSMVDYAVPEVRERMTGCIREFCENYDIDGLEYDYTRDPMVLKSVAMTGYATQEECDFLTNYMVELRRMTEEIGRRRGRPILIAVRVPNAPDYCRACGLDVDEWFRRGAADIIVADNWLKMDSYDASFAVPKQCGAKCYAAIDNICTNGRKVNWQSVDWRAGAVGEALSSQADGVYYFNVFGASVKTIVMNDVSDVLGRDKFYMANSDSASRLTSFIRDGYRYSKRPMINSSLQYSLRQDNAPEVTFDLIDDFGDTAVQAACPFATAGLAVKCEGDVNFLLSVNGASPIKSVRGDTEQGNYTFSIPTTLLKKGTNSFRISLADDAKLADSTMIMKGDVALRGEIQAPWRRIMSHEDSAKEERVEDGMYIFDDITAKESYAPNMLYPLFNAPQKKIDLCFEARLLRAGEPDATMVRIADGDFAEVIRLTPNGLDLKYAGKVLPCRTDDGFHQYHVIADGKRLVLQQDGVTLADMEMTLAVSDPACVIKEAVYSISQMEQHSLCFGSISGIGTGASAWRNVKLQGEAAVFLTEFNLALKFNHKQ